MNYIFISKILMVFELNYTNIDKKFRVSFGNINNNIYIN